jgi:hypothetical protein
MNAERFSGFFKKATGYGEPFDHQCRMAGGDAGGPCVSQLISVPVLIDADLARQQLRTFAFPRVILESDTAAGRVACFVTLEAADGKKPPREKSECRRKRRTRCFLLHSSFSLSRRHRLAHAETPEA